MSAPHLYEQTDFDSETQTLVEWRRSLHGERWTARDLFGVALVSIAAGACAIAFIVLFCLLAAIG